MMKGCKNHHHFAFCNIQCIDGLVHSSQGWKTRGQDLVLQPLGAGRHPPARPALGLPASRTVWDYGFMLLNLLVCAISLWQPQPNCGCSTLCLMCHKKGSKYTHPHLLIFTQINVTKYGVGKGEVEELSFCFSLISESCKYKFSNVKLKPWARLVILIWSPASPDTPGWVRWVRWVAPLCFLAFPYLVIALASILQDSHFYNNWGNLTCYCGWRWQPPLVGIPPAVDTLVCAMCTSVSGVTCEAWVRELVLCPQAIGVQGKRDASQSRTGLAFSFPFYVGISVKR